MLKSAQTVRLHIWEADNKIRDPQSDTDDVSAVTTYLFYSVLFLGTFKTRYTVIGNTEQDDSQLDV